MGELMLMRPTDLYEEQVILIREEMLKNGDNFGGCAGLEDVKSYSEWLDFEGRLKAKYKDGYVSFWRKYIMAFKLDSVVPWGRNLEEYKLMFQLDDSDMSKKIAGFGDGPACFNFEATNKGSRVVSFDPIYQFSKEEIENRIEEVRVTVMQQMKENMNNYVWTHIKDLDELEQIRMSAMKKFLSDYEQGKKEGRYVFHELPARLPYESESFDMGLSSHFLLMYTSLGYDFHIQSITEMLRVCKEIRIFPIVDLDANKTNLIKDVIDYFRKNYDVSIVKTDYEFQKGDNKLLIIRKQK